MINDFLEMWRKNTLDKDATWRGYEILAVAGPEHVKPALKKLRLGYAGDLGVSEFMAQHGIKDRLEAEAILSSWYVWHRLRTTPNRYSRKYRGPSF